MRLYVLAACNAAVMLVHIVQLPQNASLLREDAAAWNSGNVVGHANEVALRRPRLVLKWVAVREYIVVVCNQPLTLTQRPNLSGTRNDTDQESVLCGREGNRRYGVALAMRQHSVVYSLTGSMA